MDDRLARTAPAKGDRNRTGRHGLEDGHAEMFLPGGISALAVAAARRVPVQRCAPIELAQFVLWHAEMEMRSSASRSLQKGLGIGTVAWLIADRSDEVHLPGCADFG